MRHLSIDVPCTYGINQFCATLVCGFWRKCISSSRLRRLWSTCQIQTFSDIYMKSLFAPPIKTQGYYRLPRLYFQMYALQFWLAILLSCPVHRLLAQYTSPSVSSKVLDIKCAKKTKLAGTLKEGIQGQLKKMCHSQSGSVVSGHMTEDRCWWYLSNKISVCKSLKGMVGKNLLYLSKRNYWHL